jgi:hypothetical protein
VLMRANELVSLASEGRASLSSHYTQAPIYIRVTFLPTP